VSAHWETLESNIVTAVAREQLCGDVVSPVKRKLNDGRDVSCAGLYNQD
jgi:hypothetical protein